jgi:hypothetical protein
VLQTIIFLLVFLVPLIAYALNAYAARRPGGIAGGVTPPKPPKEAKPPKSAGERVKRSRARVRRVGERQADCGRAWTHLWLSLAGARDSCRYCLDLDVARQAEPSPPTDRGPAPPTTIPEAADALAEVERMLEKNE